jgi:hypothetical protein
MESGTFERRRRTYLSLLELGVLTGSDAFSERLAKPSRTLSPVVSLGRREAKFGCSDSEMS